jgi:hypothetical protein
MFSIRFCTVHVLIVNQRLAARSTGKFKTPVSDAAVDVHSIISSARLRSVDLNISFSSQWPATQRARRGVNPIFSSRFQVSISNLDSTETEISNGGAGIVICKMKLQMYPMERRSKYRGLAPPSTCMTRDSDSGPWKSEVANRAICFGSQRRIVLDFSIERYRLFDGSIPSFTEHRKLHENGDIFSHGTEGADKPWQVCEEVLQLDGVEQDL